MKKIIPVFIGLLITNLAFNRTPSEIDRVDPPFWWTGMHHTDLQLLVQGNDLVNFTPTISYPGVIIKNSLKPENPNYIFLNLEISHDCEPGIFSIDFIDGDNKLTFDYELKKRAPKEGRQAGLNQGDVVYLIMPDRFSNGDVSNDNMEDYSDQLARNEPYGRHGGDIQGVINKLDYLKDLGITAIWTTPLLDNNMESYSYHGYSITDYYKTDPRFGNNEDYKRLVEEAHKRGIKVIIDIVFNQVGTNHHLVSDLPMSDWIHQFNTFTQTNFVGSSIPDPNASKYDSELMISGWFDINMPDMNQRNPLVAEYQKQFVTWWIEYANFDAIRFDTYQYNEKHMLANWAKEIREEYPNLYIAAEVWVNDPAIVSTWQENGPGNYNSHCPAVFDFPLYYGIIDAFSNDKGVRSLYDVISHDFLYSNPHINMTFNNNHDLDRLYNLIGRDVNAMKMIAGFLLTTRGIPQIYYGDEILATGKGEYNHGNMRIDFPGGWPGAERDAFTPQGRTDVENEYFNHLRTLLNWRKENTDLISAKLVHFIPQDEVYVYFRTTGDKALMVIMNNNTESQDIKPDRYMEVLKSYSTAKDIITNKEHDLKDDLIVPAKTTQILELY